jgi:hypothetical protein
LQNDLSQLMQALPARPSCGERPRPCRGL